MLLHACEGFFRRFQAVLGGSRGLQGPQGPPGPPEASKGEWRGFFKGSERPEAGCLGEYIYIYL